MQQNRHTQRDLQQSYDSEGAEYERSVRGARVQRARQSLFHIDMIPQVRVIIISCHECSIAAQILSQWEDSRNDQRFI